uniref:Cytochrome c oxidase subunit 3 n=1 Tax=Parevania sp. ZJUH_2016024 TaxID=2491165 RepID=A0A3S8V0Z4_9HYME|nr:cytochrome c oxidase subunit 3 [Parevania sp. ZJUH_2016024]
MKNFKLFMNYNNSLHLVTNSPWPICLSFCLLNLLFSVTLFFNKNNLNFNLINLFTMFLILMQWWRDVIRESTFQGMHTKIINQNMKLGMLFFIISEIMFFLSFFWSFFHSMLSSNIYTGSSWPPLNIEMFNPFNIPLLNSIILISSGITVTWTHMSMINSNMYNSKMGLFLTIYLGLIFSSLQFFEYKESFFSINDSVYGSLFFLMTGFHGIHVLIGSSFLMICMLRLWNNQFSSNHHFGFESASWYWHFVDVIWLFLYLLVYWWPF